MSVGDLSDPAAVDKALDEFDQIGRDLFLKKYGYGGALQYVVVRNGREYDSKAIVGAAHGYQFGDPLRNTDFSGGLQSSVQKLESLGFEVKRRDEAEPDRWEEAIRLCRALTDDRERLEGQENEYKRVIAARVRAALEAAKDGRPLDDSLKEVFASPNNLLFHIGKSRFLKWTSDQPDDARRALLAIQAQGSAQDRVDLFLEPVPDSVLKTPGERIAFASLFLMGLDPASFAFYRAEPIRVFERLLAADPPADGASPGAAYEHHLDFIHTFLQRLQDAGVDARDTLDAQSLIWILTKGDEPEFRAWRGEDTTDATPKSDALHLLIRWAVAREPATIELHREIAERAGAVWWGKIGDPAARAAVGKERRAVLDKQIAEGVTTLVFLHRPGEVWRTRLLELREDRPTEELDLIPAYYRDDVNRHHLWLKLTDFQQFPPDFAEKQLVLDDYNEPDSVATALKGQSSFMYVRVTDPQGAVPQPPDIPQVWWVNQGTNYREERDGDLIWAPLAAKDGRPKHHWTSLRGAEIGDRVLHYANGSIRAVGEVLAPAEEAPRPAGLSEEGWTREGVLVQTRYVELAQPLALEQIPADWRIAQGAPFTRQGAVQQGYFYPLSPEFVNKMSEKFPQLGLSGPEGTGGEEYVEPSLSAIAESVRGAGLQISDEMLRRYHLSLKTRGFVILSGVSGTGKTWLAEAYARAVGANYLLEAVAPNWTTNEDLLGYLNPLTNSFQFTSFSQFLRDAAAEYEAAERQGRTARPFHATLDEMNLARIEYYFAKFLSAMEVRARNGTAALQLAPGTDLLLTPNLYFSGTVNVDETTKGFSDKVYDRAQLLELPVDRGSLEHHLAGKPYADLLLDVWDNVHQVAPFAFRTLDEFSEYHAAAEELGVPWEQSVDEQLLQKVLPKFKGGELRVQEALEWLVARTDGVFPLTHEKASTMLAYCREHGFTDYFA